jgi:ABC-type multidrug transport system fused ATPase/permease subunit
VLLQATNKTAMNRNNTFVSAHIQKYPFAFGGILLAGFINSCMSFLLPISIGEFFTLQFQTGSSKGNLLDWLGIHLNSLQGFYILFTTLLITKAIAGFIESLCSYRLGELFVKNIRENVFASQMNWHPPLISKNSYGKYLLRYSNDMKSIQNYFSRGIMDGIKNSLFLITGFFLLSQIHLKLTVILVSLLSLAIIIIYFVAKYQRPFIKTSRSHRSSLLTFVTKSFSNFEKLKLRQGEKEASDNFNNRSTNLYQANMLSNRMESLLQSIAPFMIFLMIGILLWQMTMSYGSISAGDGLMMILMVLMMQGAFRNILKVPGYLNKGNISLQKISKLLQPQSSEKESVVSLSP